MHTYITRIASPEIVQKGWGREEIIVNNDEFCGKILHFKAGAKFSMHAHKEKREVFWVMSGEVVVWGIDTFTAKLYKVVLKQGQSVEIPRGAFHRIEAAQASTIVEFSTHHDDEDSYRVLPGDSQKL